MNIILASGSPTRKQILEDSGVTFEVIVKPIDEASIKNSMVHEGASNLSIVSALAELKSIKVSNINPNRLVLGADSVISLNNELMNYQGNVS